MKFVSKPWLEQIMGTALARHGLSPMHRQDVVHGIMFASLRGVDTHGVPLFKTYLDELTTGRAKVQPAFEYVQHRAAIARLAADAALGMVAAAEATRRTIALTKANGVGVVVVANSNHFGAASVYATTMARAGLVGVAMTNSDALVVPVNGRVSRLGTNPISMAAEGDGGDLFCADLATSQGSFLRSVALLDSRQVIPNGVLVDSQGQDLATHGGSPAALLPLGGYKGQCLGMIVAILCALLAGEPFDWELPNLFDGPFDQPRRISHFFLGIDVGATTESSSFRRRLSEYLGAFRASPGVDNAAVACPGDLEREEQRTRAKKGIPITDEDYKFLMSLERRLLHDLPGDA